MSVNSKKTTLVWLWHKDTGARAPFDILVYGVTEEDLMTVPNPIIQSLAERYPEYTSSPFGVHTVRGKSLATRPRRR